MQAFRRFVPAAHARRLRYAHPALSASTLWRAQARMGSLARGWGSCVDTDVRGSHLQHDRHRFYHALRPQTQMPYRVPLHGYCRSLSMLSKQAANWSQSPFQHRVFNVLGLERASDEELHELFVAMAVDPDDGTPTERLYKHEVAARFHTVLRDISEPAEIDAFVDEFWAYETEPLIARAAATGAAIGGASAAMHAAATAGAVDSVSEEEFIGRIKELGQKVDNRMLPMAAIFGASGISIGIIIPVMPQLAQILSLSTAQYGTIVGAFALTKMMGNIPAAMAVERVGCKPVLSGAMVALGMAIGSIGLVNSYEGLVLCRFAGGACIAGFVSAAFVYLADISNPLNRASTIAPPSTAFTAGTALGPALGGGLHAFLDLQQTFLAGGGMIAAIGLATHLLLRPPAVLRSQRDLLAAMQKESAELQGRGDDVPKEDGVLTQWRALIRRKPIANMTALNAGYWLVLSGVNMTLLPMILVDPAFGLSSMEVGSVFAGVSVVGVVVTPIAGRLIDRFGQPQMAVPAAAVLASAMVASAFTDDLQHLLTLVGVWTVAGSILSVAPTAYVTDLTDFRTRPQALAMLRTAGDVGMLTGSIVAGIIADQTSNLQAIQVNGAVMLGIAALTGVRFLSILRASP